MKIKWVIFAVLVVFLILVMNPGSKAVNTREVDNVRKKAVLDNSDLKIIDDFLAEAIKELVGARDFTSIAQLRTVILSRQSTQSQQGQYAQQFSESARRYIAQGFLDAQQLPRQERITGVTINLLILVDGLNDLELANQAVPMLKNENMVIRYWAVHSLTSPDIITQLNIPANSNQAAVLAAKFTEILDTSTPEIIALIAQFAAGVKIPQAEQLLCQIADIRIKQYAAWTVKYELYDSAILKYLSSKIPSASQSSGSTSATSKTAVARCFAQLYSYVIQRYVKGADILNDTQKSHLISVLADIEEKCISTLLKPQMTIRRALGGNSMPAILAEHDRLLGSATTPGELPQTLKFDYSTNPSGPKLTAPIPLPDPSAKK
ncbi:MAG: hypothetical protein H8D56_18435 [Planctomycetes bacterium]|nr:hypothetical protein [Planctomycetota bacterium]MBL7147147.1 hypothetical protein [Phycisphaerae bacterium]